MTLQSLINVRGGEAEVLQNVIMALQENFLKYQTQAYLLPLEIAEDKLTSVTSIETYPLTKEGQDEIFDYIYSGPFEKMFVLIQFGSWRYKLKFFGRHRSLIYGVCPNEIEQVYHADYSNDRTTQRPCRPPDWVVEAIADITSELKKSG
jgi:hypothetical protein